jgi:hypothetical protein
MGCLSSEDLKEREEVLSVIMIAHGSQDRWSTLLTFKRFAVRTLASGSPEVTDNLLQV